LVLATPGLKPRRDHEDWLAENAIPHELQDDEQPTDPAVPI
jgi:hypothetical protein